MTAPLILASTSRYRAELLSRLGMPFATEAPGVDETALPGEAPAELALRLAREKARAVHARYPQAIVIGSDQLAANGDVVLGKPGTVEAAIAQLERASGRTLVFHTAVCVCAPQFERAESVTVEVQFRTLTRVQIERYVARERPLDCAGSFKSEGLGIVLFDAMRSDDPTAIVGLPLIRTAALLRDAGLDPLGA